MSATVQESAAFFARTGLGEVPQVVVNGYPLKREELKGEFEETVVSTILRQTGELQKAVYNVGVYVFIFFYFYFQIYLACKFKQDCAGVETMKRDLRF